jgi:hypothetical protein
LKAQWAPVLLWAAECLLAVVVREDCLEGRPSKSMRPNVAVQRIRAEGAENLGDDVVPAWRGRHRAGASARGKAEGQSESEEQGDNASDP